MTSSPPTAEDSREPKRRLFRFRLRTLLALPIVFAAMWWWVTWPERSANKFVGLLAAGDIEAARAMIDGPQPTAAFWQIVSSGKVEFERLTFQSASWNEYLTAQRQFNFDWEFNSHDGGLGPFVAERNRVRVGPPSVRGNYFVVYFLAGNNAESVGGELASLYTEKDDHRIRVDEGKNQILVGGSDRTHSEVRALIRLAEEGRRLRSDAAK